VTLLQRQLFSLAVLSPGITVERAAKLLDIRTHTAASVLWSIRHLVWVDELMRAIYPRSWVTA